MNWFLLGLACTVFSSIVGYCCFLLGYVVGGRDEARALAETLREVREETELSFGLDRCKP